jgi:CS domain
MSRLSDYSRFDHLDTDSDDDDDHEGRQQQSNSSTTAASPVQVLHSTGPNAADHNAADANVGGIFTRHPEHANRFVYECPKGIPVYSWEQTLDSVTLFIPTDPKDVTRASQLDCRIQPNRLQVGLRPPPPRPFFLDEPTAGTVDIHNSTWTWENDVLTLELFKANKGVVWRAVTLGKGSNNDSTTSASSSSKTTAAQLDPFQLEQEQKRLLLERWQEENPGMDFRDAEFNGSVPDPRTFMGGVRYD